MEDRWESYVFYRKEENLKRFWNSYYKADKQANVLFVLGKGFDPRMNNILRLLLTTVPHVHVDCLCFDFPDKQQPSNNTALYDSNVQALVELCESSNCTLLKDITIDTTLSWEKRIVRMCRQLNDMDLAPYSDCIIDVSALPRALYFNIAKVLFNKYKSEKSRNLFFAVSENPDLDAGITKIRGDEEVYPLVGFKGKLGVESFLDRVNVLIPLIGEGKDKERMLEVIYNSFEPSDIFPVLPFPSANPRRSDSLLREYHSFFRDKWKIEQQNITYADEQNPFELYRILSQLAKDYMRTLDPISKNVCFGVAVLSSKLLSIGALLLGLEYNDCVAVYNVSSTSYNIKDKDTLEKRNKDSEPFLMWITGEAYNEE